MFYRIIMFPVSTELNPIKRGAYGRSAELPIWPRNAGAVLNPKGLLCKLCPLTFDLGGFAEQFGSMEKMIEQIDGKNGEVFRTEFIACIQQLMHYIEIGKVKMKLRGSFHDVIDCS